MPRRTLAGLLWFALICWACGILWMSSLTPQELPDAAFLLSDKINHGLAFVAGGWLAASALRLSWPAAVASRIVIAVILVAAFGALDESVQTFTPGRTGNDVYDWTADLLGAVAGAMLSLATHERVERMVASVNRP
ncbi:hypothetical protein NGTWS0302_24250 [Mycolicibacterium cyprinidarum]|uniref:VanZ-like domain-containing protein n=1 Tax=Mycolicibacterium cyprinidarum TaxID=2860311 RepID=A0ABQ4VAV5_9MYCO|nr:hypothetical protein NGTWS0302_24250 [Mycolicibacterium sp. NGTWS0302]GJF13434.1 hypothetical protein NGTWS1803_24820 [Mycolicibacterium sp. NGTWS1803]GJF17154.1 hypothetical protein NGTWS1702_23140 [Mycolicibacterium sp. NGTWSNA01]